jgi:hypothetical protein
MLPPRSFSFLRQCLSCLRSISHIDQRPFSSYNLLLQESKPKPQGPFFVPKTPTDTAPSFKQSPIRSPTTENFLPESPKRITIENIPIIEQARVLPQTGKFSGRTVSCKAGQADRAFVILSQITKDNNIREEWEGSRVRYKPSTARRLLRSKRHRIRFKQGIARLVNIVLRMRKKSY